MTQTSWPKSVRKSKPVEGAVFVEDFADSIIPGNRLGRDWAQPHRWAVAPDTGVLVSLSTTATSTTATQPRRGDRAIVTKRSGDALVDFAAMGEPFGGALSDEVSIKYGINMDEYKRRQFIRSSSPDRARLIDPALCARLID